MNITIRNEKKEDYYKVEEVAREAFWNLYIPGCEEHFVMHNMRKHPDFIKALTFVIEVEGEIVGSIFFTHSKIVEKSGREFPTITFGPVSILPKYHRMGLGRKLITHAIQKATEMGYKAILTLGYDYHYTPYGFKRGKNYGISMMDGKFYKGLLVLPLFKGALDNVSGHVVFSGALEINQDELEEFDKQFPCKEKKVEESQRIFAIECGMLDE